MRIDLKWYVFASILAVQPNAVSAESENESIVSDPIDEGEVQKTKRSAEEGRTAAQHALGLMYLAGRGVPQNQREAEKWFRKAAESGSTGSQYVLGVLHYGGQGVRRDWVEAKKWLSLAATAGHVKAQFLLGTIYFKQAESGRETDFNTTAFVFFSLAASFNHEQAPASLKTVSDRMTRRQISHAKKLARICRSSQFMECPYPR